MVAGLALSPSPDLFFGAGKLLFSFCEGEGDSTRESARGQFSIFGATEEKEVCGILVRMGVKKNLNQRGRGAWSKRFWGRTMGAGNLLGEERSGCAQGMHRKCRKSLGNGRFQDKNKIFNTEGTGEYRGNNPLAIVIECRTAATRTADFPCLASLARRNDKFILRPRCAFDVIPYSVWQPSAGQF